MKAIVFDAPGEPAHVLRVREIDVPQPASDEVLVRVAARPIQPSDLMFIARRYRMQPVLPQVAGLEGSGTVVAAGAGVTLAPGTRVAFRHPGSWAEYACVPASAVHVVPDDIADEDAAQFSLNPITAWGLLEQARATAGEWIAVNAATSQVARLVMGLAGQRKLRVLAMVRKAPAQSLPAATAVVVSDPASDSADVSERILAATAGAPVAALFDAVGGTALTRVLPALRPGATIVSYGLLGDAPAPVSNADMIYRNLTWTGFGIDHWLAHAGARQREQMVAALWRAIAEGAITLPVKARFPIWQVSEAIRALREPGLGKVLLCTPPPSETQ